MIKLDPNSKTPVYLQIVQSVKHGVMTAKLHPGTQIPSVRKLARELSINPNTVQKAYMILHEEGFTYSVKGKGDFVADNAAHIKKIQRAEAEETIRSATRAARDAGLWIDEIFALVDETYSNS